MLQRCDISEAHSSCFQSSFALHAALKGRLLPLDGQINEMQHKVFLHPLCMICMYYLQQSSVRLSLFLDALALRL